MKCLIVTGGEPPGIELLDRLAEGADLLIGVDGAAGLLRKRGLVPGILIGDFDTAEPETVLEMERRGAKIIRLKAEKNETDTEAALSAALRAGADDITVTGALGGRIDHALSNIMMLVKAESAGARCRLIDEAAEIFVSNGEVVFCGEPGRTVSILPLTGEVTVCSSGLKYPLDSLKLKWGSSRGISNVMTGGEASLRISGGYALVIMNLKR